MKTFGPIEKLIAEHGSAAMLRKRITQLKEQVAVLESKAKALESAVAQLKPERDRLQRELYAARAEIKQLKQPPMQQVAWGSQPRIKERIEM